jgi:hypothetical protein
VLVQITIWQTTIPPCAILPFGQQDSLAEKVFASKHFLP